MRWWRESIDEAHGPFKWLSYEFNTQKYLSNQNWNQNWCIRKMVSIDHGAPSSLFPQLLCTLTCVFIASLHLVLCYLLYCTRYICIASLHLVLCYLLYCTRYICIASLHLVLCYLLYCTHYICTQLIINCQKTWKYISLSLSLSPTYSFWVHCGATSIHDAPLYFRQVAVFQFFLSPMLSTSWLKLTATNLMHTTNKQNQQTNKQYKRSSMIIMSLFVECA